ncbi:hypothetical protein [Micromonospora sp. NPDC093277]
MFDTDRMAETTVSVKGDMIDAWYSRGTPGNTATSGRKFRL